MGAGLLGLILVGAALVVGAIIGGSEGDVLQDAVDDFNDDGQQPDDDNDDPGIVREVDLTLLDLEPDDGNDVGEFVLNDQTVSDGNAEIDAYDDGEIIGQMTIGDNIFPALELIVLTTPVAGFDANFGGFIDENGNFSGEINSTEGTFSIGGDDGFATSQLSLTGSIDENGLFEFGANQGVDGEIFVPLVSVNLTLSLLVTPPLG